MESKPTQITFSLSSFGAKSTSFLMKAQKWESFNKGYSSNAKPILIKDNTTDEVLHDHILNNSRNYLTDYNMQSCLIV